MNFDIEPFALPNSPRNEIRFEEPRDVTRLVIQFQQRAPDQLSLSYTRQKWPGVKLEATDADRHNPCSFGWAHSDDWFNGKWHQAAILIETLSADSVAITFAPLTEEIPEQKAYAVSFRRALALRVDVPEDQIKAVSVFTRSIGASTRLRVELDCGRPTVARRVKIAGHNAAPDGDDIDCSSVRTFDLTVDHMLPAHRYSGDDAHLTFSLDGDGETFTISLSSLQDLGPIWFEELGVYIRRADDPASFVDYRDRIAGQQTVTQQVLQSREHSLSRAMLGQPRPHPVSYILACPLHPQRFRLEPNGDLVLEKWPVVDPPAKANARFKNEGNGRMFFGLERWIATARFTDPAPSPAYNIHARLDEIFVEQKSVAVPLGKSIGADLTHDDAIVALMKFTFTNSGNAPANARMLLRYSSDSGRSRNPRDNSQGTQEDHLVPNSRVEPLSVSNDSIEGTFKDEQALRCVYQTTMDASAQPDGILFHKLIDAGQTCQLLLKVPYIAIDTPEELESLRKLDIDSALAAANAFWRKHCAAGAQINSPESRLNDLHRSHLMHVAQTDLLMPDGSGLINTSVGTSTYGNFSNESCMIIHDLHERGLFEDARRRLELWIKYQGSVPQPGNFTDFKGMYFGAAGFERGAYNQHHGWVLWCLAEHYFFTRDDAWLKRVAESIVAGCDWIIRQRKNTVENLPHSRGWERGFLPAGSLEDVTDFYYWLSTNSLTWRGLDHAARALEQIKHKDASRLRSEADAYKRDLVRGFETNRQHSPLVRLRSGKWVPHYPSRLYCRGRDIGWIRETLEGAVYLLISGLYASADKRASWILDDYQDNRYPCPPFGYAIPDFEGDWFCRAGFSIQPTLLAGLMPHLDRDESEVAIWMFFNAFAACYRDEIGALVEHPFPQLGYSNAAHYKTSDQSNSMVWLRHLLVHYTEQGLMLGGAIPRAWLADGQQASATDVHTPFGKVSVAYTSRAASGEIVANVDLAIKRPPLRSTVRFRHLTKAPLRAVDIDGKPHPHFDPHSGDVDVTGKTGRLSICARY